MRIVLFNKQEKAGGGIGVFTKRLKHFLLKQGHEVFEIRYTNEPESVEFFKVPYVFADKNTFVFIPDLHSKKIIEEHLMNIKPDLVYLPIGSSVFDLYMPRICRKLGIKLIGVCHTDISRSTKITTAITSLPFRFYLPVAERVGILQVFTKELKEFFVKLGVDAKKVVIIPNGVDEKKYCPGKSVFKRENNIKNSVLFMGRITAIKNPETLIKSYLEVADRRTKLIFMGQGDLSVKLRKKYPDERIVFLGHVSDEKRKIDVIRGCNVFVLPSWYEGMSLALLEAMACGLHCIVSDVASHREVLDGVGTVIPLQDLKERLPGEIKKAISDSKHSRSMGLKARARVLKCYSQEAVFSEISKEFGLLLKNN